MWYKMITNKDIHIKLSAGCLVLILEVNMSCFSLITEVFLFFSCTLNTIFFGWVQFFLTSGFIPSKSPSNEPQSKNNAHIWKEKFNTSIWYIYNNVGL